MLELKRIVHSESALFEKLVDLYKDAFPVEERREIKQLKYLIDRQSNMYFNAAECDGKLAGLFVYWDFEEFYYLEHLAVFAEMRNHKIGQQVLDWAKAHLQKIRLLEVEPAKQEMACRRIHYYERNGYKILDKDYVQPSYDGVHDSLPLWIMGNAERAYSPETLRRYLEKIQEEVYYKPRLFLQHTGK